jgi:hypothetical protein
MYHVETPQSVCRLGIARGELTPPAGIYHRMWGAATHTRATGVHRPLTATAVVLQAVDDPARQLVVVAMDHCLLWHDAMTALLDSITARTAVPRDEIVVTFSHTHAAGLMDLARSDQPGGEWIGPYLRDVAARVSELIQQAQQNIANVAIAYGTGHCALAANRDFWDRVAGQSVCGFNPAGVTDDTVLVARVTGEDGRLVATFVNYACHPTTLGWQNTLISPDYPGAMRELVEAATGVPCVFLQGTSGDLGPREGFVADPAVADRNGRQLGYAALAALEALPPAGTRFQYSGPVVSGATLGTWCHVPLSQCLRRKAGFQFHRWTVDLPYRADLPNLTQTERLRDRWATEQQIAQQAGDLKKARDAGAMVERMDRQQTRLKHLPPGATFPLPVVLCHIGDAIWLAVEGEHYSLLQRSLRARFAGSPILVATLANGARPAYLPTMDAYGKGIYQETIAVLAAGSLEQLICVIGREIDARVGGSGNDLPNA